MTHLTLIPSCYKKLLLDIGRLYENARKTLVESYWLIGQRIVEVEQNGAVRAAYGSGLLQKISGDLSPKLGLGFSRRNLERMRGFYLAHPKTTPASQLSWSQQLELLRVKDVKKRKTLEAKVSTEGLTKYDIRKLINEKFAAGRVVDVTPLAPKRGLVNTYRIKDPGEVGWPVKEVLLLDRGFRSYRALTPRENRGLKPGDVIELVDGKLRKTGRTEEDLYTYKTYLQKAIDGDTLWVALDTGSPEIVHQKLRLRGIDCPELKKPGGQAAKKFVESVLSGARGLTVYSSRNDKYDRYEADVFFTDRDGKEIFLNNLLLGTGHAVRMRG